MKYTKPPLSFSEQADKLIARGLIAKDREMLVAYLQRVNYYRLSGYWFNFLRKNDTTNEEHFEPDTTFEMIQNRYEFDRQLRLLLMDAIERIEVAILRTRMTELHVRTYGPFGYADYSTYNPKFPYEEFRKLLTEIKRDEKRSYEEFINRYRGRYTSEAFLPLWIVTELMSFGQLFTLFHNLDLHIKQQLSHELDLYPQVLDSWLHTLNYIRNCCAHHSRLWNRPLAVRPKLPPEKRDGRWYAPIAVDIQNIFVVVLIVHYLMCSIAPHDGWKGAFEKLLNDNPTIPLRPLGFPENWMDCPIWK